MLIFQNFKIFNSCGKKERPNQHCKWNLNTWLVLFSQVKGKQSRKRFRDEYKSSALVFTSHDSISVNPILLDQVFFYKKKTRSEDWKMKICTNLKLAPFLCCQYITNSYVWVLMQFQSRKLKITKSNSRKSHSPSQINVLYIDI